MEQRQDLKLLGSDTNVGVFLFYFTQFAQFMLYCAAATKKVKET